MRQEIAIKLAAGEDTETIKAYFLAQYGPQVLGEPPRAGFNWLAWLLPVIALAGGAIFLLVRGRSLFINPARRSTSAPPQPAETEDDPYASQLEEELKHYG
jgi:cytochrome c-type biogenesis protein CcmH